MAVYTTVTAAELEDFLAGYDLGALRSCKGIAEGVENSNFLLQTERGRFILTLYEKRVAADDLPFFLALMEHLVRRGITCPQPIKNREGALLGRLAGRPAALSTFLDGVCVTGPTPLHCAQLGQAMAGLHRAGADFPLRRPNALSLGAWPALFAAAGPAADAVSPGLIAEIAVELEVLERRWPKGLPAGVIHADLFTDNVFFLGDRLSGLIDFYFACTDFFAYDLSIGLNAWCFDHADRFDPERGRALLDGYRATRPLTPEEIENLPVLARGAALRFMLTRLVDWLNVPEGALVKPKNPLEYLNKLRFHRTVGSAGDYGWQ